MDVQAIYRCWRMCLFFFPHPPTPSLIDTGQLHSFILPIMQGYCQISQFSIPSDPAAAEEDSMVEYMIISRRSKFRPGLRLQRRGIDDEAHVANFVETETIMRVEVSFFFVNLRLGLDLFYI
jgi:phosphatidylinositol 4-phosphatase